PAGTVTIEKNDGTILYAGVDFDLEPDSAGKAMVRWRGGSTWLAPSPNETYRVHVASSSGYVYDLGGWSRAASDPLAPADLGFTHAGGTFLPGTVTSGGKTFTSPFSMSVSGGSFMLDWNTSTPTVPRAIPGPGDELTLSYRFDANTFQVDDGGSGLLRAIGLDKTDEEHLTAAQDALVVVDGEEWNLVENELDYENEILNGVKMEFKSVGEVSLEIIHDTEKAVETVDAFVESYNALIQWINVRSSEKQVNTDYSSDESNSFYRSMDEFNTSWGLLYGNSYLRSTKSTLRTIVTQDYPYTFVERVSADPIYGDMAFNGLKRMVRGDGTEEDVTTTLRIKLGSERYANITITSSDTLETIAAKINDEGTDPKTNEAWALHYDEADRYDADGQELSAAELFAKRKSYVKAEVVNNKLVIKTGGSAAAGEEISLSGTDAVNALKMNNSYKGLYQVGIGTTANDYGKSGELEFNSSAFVSALEDRPDEVEKLMMGFAKQMDAQMKTMLTSSGDMSGTLTRQIANIETQISDIDKYLAKFQQRLDDKEEALRRQYAAAEERIAKISEQASSLSGLIAQLNAYRSSGGGQ
ncbi:MAG: flagellar filament capping protein FliD, partial [Synergistaceae bacterium]|nr:flagellar filament capping protein FliD [Synergistaceae bacterium]